MPYKLNISEKGKAWKLELESDSLAGKKLGEKLEGKELSNDLAGYELIITGASDFAGFPHKKDVEGSELRKVLLTKGWGMKQKQKGLRRKKTVRGTQISDKTVQINMNVTTAGNKKLAEIFPEQNKPKEAKKEGVGKPVGDNAPEEPAGVGSPVSQQVGDNNQKLDETSKKDRPISEIKKEEKPMENQTEEKAEEIKEEIAEEVAEEVKDDIPKSPETATEEKKEEAAEKVGEEVAEEVEDVAEKIAEEEEK